MKVERCVKESFAVIGKVGSTLDGEGFIQRLWVDANSHFGEVQHLAKKDENGNISGIWGAMSDFSHVHTSYDQMARIYRDISCSKGQPPPRTVTVVKFDFPS